MIRMLHCCLLLLLACTSGFAAETSEQEQRARIQQGREAAKARHAEREQVCRKQFVVTPCLEKARIEKLEAMRVLRAQEVLLDEAERKRRSQAQAERVAERQVAAGTREAASAASSATKHEPRTAKAPRTKLPHASSASGPSAAARASEEQQKRAAFNERQREIEAHREAVERRNAERAAKKTVRPLPVPAAAASAADPAKPASR